MMVHNRLIEPGALEIFCGPMKSGKTLELLHRVEKVRYMNDCSYMLFKPAIDTRDKIIKTRFYSLEADCATVNEPEEIPQKLPKNCKVVAIDEGQFFRDSLAEVVLRLLNSDMNVIIAGLDLDFRGEPFGPMPKLLSMANYVKKLTAVCQYAGCNSPATRSQRLIMGEPASYFSSLLAVEGSAAEESYESRCLKHHQVPGKNTLQKL